jgi:ribosome-associated protein
MQVTARKTLLAYNAAMAPQGAADTEGWAMAAQIDPAEVEFSAIRAQGPGGQNVNKVSCAVHARFDVAASSLPPAIKERLLALRDARITGEGVIVLKAQQSRSLEQNKMDALRRLQALVDQAAVVPVTRRATRPTRGSQLRRLDAKTRSGQVKALRGKVSE